MCIRDSRSSNELNADDTKKERLHFPTLWCTTLLHFNDLAKSTDLFAIFVCQLQYFRSRGNQRLDFCSRTQSKGPHCLPIAIFLRGKYFGALEKFYSFIVGKNMLVNVPNFFFWPGQQQTLYLGCLFPNSRDNELKLLDHSIVTKFWKHSDEPRHIKLAKHDCKEGFKKDVERTRLEPKRRCKKAAWRMGKSAGKC